MSKTDYLNPKINNIEKQEISIQVSLNGFSFLIQDTGNKECLAFKHYPFKSIFLIDELIREVENLVSHDTAFNNNYTSTKICFITQKSTLIPEEFFKPEHIKKYFEFSHVLNELDELHYNYLPSIQAYNVFSIPNYLTSIFYKTGQPSPTFTHQATSMIEYGMRHINEGEVKALIGIN